MRFKIYIFLTLFLTNFLLYADNIDFLSQIKSSEKLSKGIGLRKLSVKEQLALNEILNSAYNLGVKDANKNGENFKKNKARGGVQFQNAFYETQVDEAEDDIVKLKNGGIVQISFGFLGFVRFNADAVLFKDGDNWKIWIEDKKVFNCKVIKSPILRPNGTAEKVSISEMMGNGSIIKALDGSLYQVGDFHRIETALWLSLSDGLLINGNRWLNFDEGEIVDVQKIR